MKGPSKVKVKGKGDRGGELNEFRMVQSRVMVRSVEARNDVEGREQQSFATKTVRTEESQLPNDRQEMSVSGVLPLARAWQETGQQAGSYDHEPTMTLSLSVQACSLFPGPLVAQYQRLHTFLAAFC